MVSKRMIRAWAAVRVYRKRLREDSEPYNPPPYVPPPDPWGRFSTEFSEEFDQ